MIRADLLYVLLPFITFCEVALILLVSFSSFQRGTDDHFDSAGDTFSCIVKNHPPSPAYFVHVKSY